MKEKALHQLEEIEQWVDMQNMHTTIDNGSRRGAITSGLPYLALCETLQDCKHPPDILKLAMVYPMPQKAISTFLRDHDEVKVLEELDDELERSIKALAYDLQLTTRITGKNGIADWIGEYTPKKKEIGNCSQGTRSSRDQPGLRMTIYASPV